MQKHDVVMDFLNVAGLAARIVKEDPRGVDAAVEFLQSFYSLFSGQPSQSSSHYRNPRLSGVFQRVTCICKVA